MHLHLRVIASLASATMCLDMFGCNVPTEDEFADLDMGLVVARDASSGGGDSSTEVLTPADIYFVRTQRPFPDPENDCWDIGVAIFDQDTCVLPSPGVEQPAGCIELRSNVRNNGIRGWTPSAPYCGQPGTHGEGWTRATNVPVGRYWVRAANDPICPAFYEFEAILVVYSFEVTGMDPRLQGNSGRGCVTVLVN